MQLGNSLTKKTTAVTEIDKYNQDGRLTVRYVHGRSD